MARPLMKDAGARSSSANSLNSEKAYGISSQGQLAKISSTKDGETEFIWGSLKNHANCTLEQKKVS